MGFEENSLTQSLQLILDILLKAKSTTAVIVNLIRVFNDHLAIDFQIEINKSKRYNSLKLDEKMMLRLTLKCIDRLL